MFGAFEFRLLKSRVEGAYGVSKGPSQEGYKWVLGGVKLCAGYRGALRTLCGEHRVLLTMKGVLG